MKKGYRQGERDIYNGDLGEVYIGEEIRLNLADWANPIGSVIGARAAVTQTVLKDKYGREIRPSILEKCEAITCVKYKMPRLFFSCIIDRIIQCKL